jgi:hypothetical protein
MADLNQALVDLKNYKRVISNMKDDSTTCTDIHSYVTDIMRYLVRNNLGQDRHDRWDNQIESSIQSIGNHKYGTNSKSSKALFNDAKRNALWFLDGFISQTQKKIDNGDS